MKNLNNNYAGKKIVVLTNGWVLMGNYSPEDLKLTQASVIRVWGTERGLGQIALEGPAPQTVLDPCGTVLLNEPAILFMIDVVYDNPAKPAA